MPKRKYLLTSTCESCVRPAGPLASGSSPTLTRPTVGPSASGSSGPTCPNGVGNDGKCILTHTAFGSTSRPPTTNGDPVQCRSGDCAVNPVAPVAKPCGGGSIDFITGAEQTWVGTEIDGVCVQNPDGWSSSTGPLVHPPITLTQIDHESPYWECNTTDNTAVLSGSSIRLCDENVLLPKGYCFNSTIKPSEGGVVKRPDGSIDTAFAFCRDPPFEAIRCVYTNTDDTDVFQKLMKASTGYDVPSLDESICDKHKNLILDAIIEALETSSSIPVVGGALLYLTTPILVGMGRWDDATVNSISSIPVLGPIIGPKLEEYIASQRAESNQKEVGPPESVLDFIDDALSTYATVAIFNPITAPTVPFAIVYQALILFGRKKWDKALITLLPLSQNAAGKFLPKGVIDKFEDIKAVVWSKLGQVPGLQEAIAASGATAALGYFSFLFQTPT